jgi:DNA-binding MarR family transcriptional regulator
VARTTRRVGGKRAGRPGDSVPLQEDAASIGFLLQRAHSVIRGRLIAVLQGSGLHLGHVAILGMLVKEDGLTQRQLSLRTGIEKSSMVLFIDHLEREGWIERSAYPGDRRAHAIVVTRRGAEQLRLLGPRLAQSENDALKSLSASDKEKLRDYLLAIIGT